MTASALRPGGSTARWRKLRAYVLERDCHTCQVNGPRCLGVANTVDHITPRARWPEGLPGVDGFANLRAACKPCNYAGGAAITNGRRDGRPRFGRSREW